MSKPLKIAVENYRIRYCHYVYQKLWIARAEYYKDTAGKLFIWKIIHHQMRIIKLPRLFLPVITKSVKIHNAIFCFVEYIAVIGNTV